MARLLWSMVAAGMLLWLMRDLGLRPGASLLAVALAMWNPYRNEIWTSLTLGEGVAMPFALLGLVCAVRASRSTRAWPWDVVGSLGVLAALGCKNTFAAVVPAQMLLRMTAGGLGPWAGWKHHGRRACLLALVLLLPIGHYLYFKFHWHPGQYPLQGGSWVILGKMLRAVAGAVSFDFMGVGLALALLAVVLPEKRSR
jgi:hypothetical protein